MHELGIVFKIIDTVKETAAENQVSQVLSVTLDVGEVSTVIPSYLTDCWDWAVKKHDILKTSKLIVHEIPAITYRGGGTYTKGAFQQAAVRCPSHPPPPARQ